MHSHKNSFCWLDYWQGSTGPDLCNISEVGQVGREKDRFKQKVDGLLITELKYFFLCWDKDHEKADQNSDQCNIKKNPEEAWTTDENWTIFSDIEFSWQCMEQKVSQKSV